MDTTDDNNGANDTSRRRDSFGGIQNDLGQVLPKPRPKCDDPAVAAAVLDSQRNHRSAVFVSHDRRAARDARRAATATIAGVRRRWASESAVMADSPQKAQANQSVGLYRLRP